jgi:hypothetical protein
MMAKVRRRATSRTSSGEYLAWFIDDPPLKNKSRRPETAGGGRRANYTPRGR